MSKKNRMVKKWLHIRELGGDPWILPIWTAKNDAVKAGRVSELTSEVKQKGGYISIRLNMLPRIINRINEQCRELYERIDSRGPKHEFSKPKEKEKVGFEIDYNLKYRLIVDIDSLLFELNSCCEHMTALFEDLYRHVGNPVKENSGGLCIKKILHDAGQDTGWFTKLDNYRNFSIHEGALNIAVDLTNALPYYDLLIMMENLCEFKDQSKFFRLSNLNDIV